MEPFQNPTLLDGTLLERCEIDVVGHAVRREHRDGPPAPGFPGDRHDEDLQFQYRRQRRGTEELTVELHPPQALGQDGSQPAQARVTDAEGGGAALERTAVLIDLTYQPRQAARSRRVHLVDRSHDPTGERQTASCAGQMITNVGRKEILEWGIVEVDAGWHGIPFHWARPTAGSTLEPTACSTGVGWCREAPPVRRRT